MQPSQGEGPVLISTGRLTRGALAGKVAVVTGAGRGIGLEAAWALAWLGARVVIAEIDKSTGVAAAAAINARMEEGRAVFVSTDVGDEKAVKHLREKAIKTCGKVDIVLNNATIAPMGAVKDLTPEVIDASYRVNLRGPFLLARAFLPGMLERDYGVFVCVSSLGGAYMAGYEVFKRAQVELAETLAAELEGTGVFAFTIGPGQAPTPGLKEGVARLAPLYGKTPEEFVAMHEAATVTVEEAGAGFAAAIALAQGFHGQEITSRQALAAANIGAARQVKEKKVAIGLGKEQLAEARALCRRARGILAEQAAVWEKRPLFERKWIFSNFRKVAGAQVEDWLAALAVLEEALENGDASALGDMPAPLEKLAAYWKHLQELARGYVQDPDELKNQLEIMSGWHNTTERLAIILRGR
jgi:NAD(P)-dependent dehydrogenase (short-subunit alcohol dehydrogenase family)